MTRIKLCGLSRREDIETANMLMPDFIGFVFAKGSRRYVDPESARELKKMLDPRIKAVGVFVDRDPEEVIRYVREGIIDMIQLHGKEGDDYIRTLREHTDSPVIRAFVISKKDDITTAEESIADHILLDAGKGEGRSFDRSLLDGIKRDYFLAGGLSPNDVGEAVRRYHPYAVDVSSGIETDKVKDPEKMKEFVEAVRRENNNG
jgi:phosphoribosylanthranilate isomerase